MNLYDQITKLSSSKLTKQASDSNTKGLSPEKVAGIAEELVLLAKEIENQNQMPVEEMPVEIPAEGIDGEVSEKEPVVEDEVIEEEPVVEGEISEEEPADEEGESKEEPELEEDSEKDDDSKEEDDTEKEEEPVKKEASSLDKLMGILKEASGELPIDPSQIPVAETPVQETPVEQPLVDPQAQPVEPQPTAIPASEELLGILEEAAVQEEAKAGEEMLQQIINGKALELAESVLNSSETQAIIQNEAEKIAYDLIPEILKIAGVSMFDYAVGLIGDEKLAREVLEDAEKIASESGMPVAYVVEDIVKVAMESAQEGN